MTDWKQVFEDAQERVIKMDNDLTDCNADCEDLLKPWLKEFPEVEQRLAATVMSLGRWYAAALGQLDPAPDSYLCAGCVGEDLGLWGCDGGARRGPPVCPVKTCRTWLGMPGYDESYFVNNIPALYDDMLREADAIGVRHEDLPSRLPNMMRKP